LPSPEALWAAVTLEADEGELFESAEKAELCESAATTDLTELVVPNVPEAADTPTAAIKVSVAAVIATTTSFDNPFNPLISLQVTPRTTVRQPGKQSNYTKG
jgi:hypothetical protein